MIDGRRDCLKNQPEQVIEEEISMPNIADFKDK